MAGKSDPTVAFLLEFLPGFFAQWFGFGHIYNGKIGKGLLVMFSYWIIQAINLLLVLVLVGFVTVPATRLLYLILSSIDAKNNAAAS